MTLSIQFPDGQTHNLIQNNINSKLLELRPQAITIFQKGNQEVDIVQLKKLIGQNCNAFKNILQKTNCLTNYFINSGTINCL